MQTNLTSNMTDKDILVHNVPTLASKAQIDSFFVNLAQQFGQRLANNYEPPQIIGKNLRFIVSHTRFLTLEDTSQHARFIEHYEKRRPVFAGWNKTRGVYFSQRVNFSFSKSSYADRQLNRFICKRPPSPPPPPGPSAGFKAEAALVGHLFRTRPVQDRSYLASQPKPFWPILRVRARSPPLNLPLPTIFDAAIGRLLPPGHYNPEDYPELFLTPREVRFRTGFQGLGTHWSATIGKCRLALSPALRAKPASVSCLPLGQLR